MAYPSSGSSSSSGFPFGDTTFTKVFVGGLAWETQSDTMRRYFDQFGDILEAVVITDKNTGRSKGYGFVTFQDPESARRACADPTPVIDGRRANCNLASLGRPRPALPSFGRIRSPALYSGGVAAAARGAYIGSFGYQNPVSYSYQQGIMYPPYGYASYGPEYIYQQGGVYNPYGGGGQQYLQMYGVPGTVSNVAAAATATAMYHHHPSSYNQLGQTVPSYTQLQGGYTLPGHHQILQFGGGVPSVNAALVTNTPIPTIQSPYHPTGVAGPVPAQPQFILPAAAAAPPQFVQGSGSEQNAG